jgi:hypothetical protein
VGDRFEHIILCIKERSDDTDDTIGEKCHQYSDDVPLDDRLRFVGFFRITSRKYVIVSRNEKRYSGDKWYHEEEDISHTSEYRTKCSDPRLTTAHIATTIPKRIHTADIYNKRLTRDIVVGSSTSRMRYEKRDTREEYERDGKEDFVHKKKDIGTSYTKPSKKAKKSSDLQKISSFI